MPTFSLARVTSRTNARNRGRKCGPTLPPGNLAGCDRIVTHYQEFLLEDAYSLGFRCLGDITERAIPPAIYIKLDLDFTVGA